MNPLHFVRRRRQRPGEKSTKAGPHFSLRLSAPVLALCSVILVLMVGWAFFMGFVVGRGDNPAEQLARFDPFVQSSRISQSGPAGATPAEETTEKDQSLAPQLQAKPERDGQDATAPHPFVRPGGEGLRAWGDDQKQEEGGQPSPAETQNESVSSPRYDYVYRIATFSRKEEAETLARKLADGLVTSEVRESGKHYIVLAKARASEREMEAFSARLVGLKVKNPKLISRREVGNSRKPSPEARQARAGKRKDTSIQRDASRQAKPLPRVREGGKKKDGASQKNDKRARSGKAQEQKKTPR